VVLVMSRPLLLINRGRRLLVVGDYSWQAVTLVPLEVADGFYKISGEYFNLQYHCTAQAFFNQILDENGRISTDD
jgi:hypothetical protein